MFRIFFALVLVVPMQAASHQYTEIVPSDRIGQSGRTELQVVHVAGPAGDSCPSRPKGGICVESLHWVVSVRGFQYTLDKIGSALEDEASLGGHRQVARGGEQLGSEREVMIRAAREAPYGVVQDVIEKCHRAGIHKIAFDVGAGAKRPANQAAETTEVELRIDERSMSVVYSMAQKQVKDLEELESMLNREYTQHVKAGDRDPHVVIAAQCEVPWDEVVKVVDICENARFFRVQFDVARR
jgi:biopolymer transport protein ExbD